MGLTFVFAIALLALGANGMGISTKLAPTEVCDGQELACSYCVDTVVFLQSVTDDAVVEAAIVKFMVVICDFINSTSPAKKECIDYINTFPARAKAATDSMFADPKELCKFVCNAQGPVSGNCQRKPTPKVDCPIAPRSDNIACEVCKSVPIFVKQILSGKGFLDYLEKYLLINCDIVAAGCQRDICIDHIKFLSFKIQFFVGEFLNPDTGCEFICVE